MQVGSLNGKVICGFVGVSRPNQVSYRGMNGKQEGTLQEWK